MKSGILYVSALAVALVLLLALGFMISARGLGVEDQAFLSVERAVGPSASDRLSWSLDHTSEVTFTSVATLRLPLVFNNWNPCAVTPTLIAPLNDVSLYTIAPLFKWDAGHNPYATQLRLRVSEDPVFDEWAKGIFYPSAQGEGSFRFYENFEPDTIYYWRAWLVCDGLKGPYSEVWSFRTGADGRLPPAPTLTAPVSGTTTESSSITLVWEPVGTAKEYLVRYREAGASTYPPLWVADTQVELALGGGMTYQWRVAARNDYGIGSDSETWWFTVPALSSAAAQDRDRKFPGGDGEGIVIEKP